MTSESEKLKACPFCGAPGNVEQYEEGWIVGCSRKAVGLTLACPLFPSFAWTNEKAEAIAAWNRRSPEGYDVAPLEWYKHNRSDLERYSAEPMFASYIITWTASGYDLYIGFWGSAAEPRKPPFKTAEEAKSAAEADYRQRILSALRPRQGTAPAVGGEPREALSEWFNRLPCEVGKREFDELVDIVTALRSSEGRGTGWRSTRHDPPTVGGMVIVGGYVEDDLGRHFDTCYGFFRITLDGPEWSYTYPDKDRHIPIQYWVRLPAHPEFVPAAPVKSSVTG